MIRRETLKNRTAKDALKLRNAVKARKPKFRRQESWRYKRLKKSWRKPRGLDNKMRLREKGWPKSVNIGYGGPRIARGLHPSGYEEVLIHTPDEMVGLDPKNHAIRIAHAVGTRKRIQITSIARERKISIINPLVRKEIEEEELLEDTILEQEGDLEKVKEQSKHSKRVKRPKEVKTNEP
ncbi:MAG: 50S ribosomal protein L32e [Candidatus Bathyarchaeota archaeon]|nr:MAG: 50S ribosomal protein L32e [Candidatus Bathyarchaeota archaeon]